MGAVARGPACSTGCYSPRGVLSCLRSEFLASGDTTRRRPSTPGEGNTGEYLCGTSRTDRRPLYFFLSLH